jgi:hypothetical protein
MVSKFSQNQSKELYKFCLNTQEAKNFLNQIDFNITECIPIEKMMLANKNEYTGLGQISDREDYYIVKKI